MAKVKISKKKKKIIAIVTSLILILGLITSLFFLIKPKDEKTINPSFHIGSMNENGEYVESEVHLYSDLFECKGLVVEPNFDSNSQYKIYFYRHDGSLVKEKTTTLLTSKYVLEDSLAITHARILIIPDLGEKESLSFWNIPGIKNDLKITVDKNQPETVNYFDVKEEGVRWAFDSKKVGLVSDVEYSALEIINLGNIKKLQFIPTSNSNLFVNPIKLLFDGTNEQTLMLSTTSQIVTIPTGATKLYVSCNVNQTFNIYIYE